jgi:hypothetical protein
MRRFLLALPALVVVLAGFGCGVGGGDSGASGSPDPSDLAREAFRAARDAGSVRYGFEASLAAEGQPPMRLSVSGAVGEKKLKADVTFDGGGQAFAGSALVDETGFFIRFLDRWYGKILPAHQEQELRQALGTEAAFGARFDEIFEGSISEGPVADGVPTWAYNGRLDTDGLLELMAKEESVDDEARKQVEELAKNTRFTLLVGKADSLPRAFQLDLSGAGIDFMGVAGADPKSLVVTMRGSFTGWGEPVSIARPHSYAPLEELFGQFFGL